ncbi:monovalent cation/H(+) antiporter subunit G [Paracoccus aminophilus]|uniref:Multicomponent K+:H+ antiporter, subunit G n=1 Tax=Paracoccus aminophilus JCM 7686 TaxID=1367847 RepID=S5XYZ4_PARAH|nr:monovalent cation/H(+) antiporter subunit G [Paracoccus aminophilus]AGT08665.1 multicomponent K+:H+ antiporter, subunit G [Paracoccus aminophilus JCM 7686]
MNGHIETLPGWAAILIAVLLIIGASLTLLGNIGLIRFRSFYERLHAPTLGASWGTASIILSSMLMFSVLNGRLIIHEIIIGIFLLVTTPVTMMLLGRAALRRDRSRGLVITNESRDPDPDTKQP